MPENDDIAKESTSIIEEIEKQLERVLAKKQEEVERELKEKIKRDKEEAHKKMNRIEEELKGEKKALDNFKASIAEFENNRAHLKDEIEKHLDKVFHYQTEIEKLAGATLEKLRGVRDLSDKLGELRQAVGEKAVQLKKELEEKFGIEAEILETKENEEKVKVDLEQELVKLRKIKEILGKSETLKSLEEIERGSEEIERKEEDLEMKDISKISKKVEEEIELPEIKEVMNISPPEEEKAIKEEPQPEIKESKEEKKEETARKEVETATFHLPVADKEELLNILENFRKTESIEGEGKINYFQRNNKIILDGEKIISAIKNRLNRAEKHYQEIYQKESPRDQFFIKQEIINNQELLRKLILRSVKKCEEESCYLPEYTADILNFQNLKDILEKLSIQNWSNEDEFKSFNTYFDSLSKAYHAKIAPYDTYIKSIIKQLG